MLMQNFGGQTKSIMVFFESGLLETDIVRNTPTNDNSTDIQIPDDEMEGEK